MQGAVFGETRMKSLVIFLVNVWMILAECPNKTFVQQHICDQCRDWTQVSVDTAGQAPHC